MIKFTYKNQSWPINNIGMYSDSTPMVKTDDWDRIAKFADTVVVQAMTLVDFFVAMSLVDSVNRQRRTDDRVKNLILPYIPGARQDRVNPTGDVLSTLHTVGTMINQRRFASVLALDPHSIAANVAINQLRHYPLTLLYGNLWKGYDAVISPDAGGVTRAGVAAETLGVPRIEGHKVRDVATGKLSGFDVSVEAGKRYIVVDDICDGGGTFVGLGEKIKEQGANVDLFVTHGIFSKGTRHLKEIYDNIYTTNSLLISDRNDVEQIDIMKELENYG